MGGLFIKDKVRKEFIFLISKNNFSTNLLIKALILVFISILG